MTEEKPKKPKKVAKPLSYRYKLLASFVDSEKKKIWDDFPELSYVLYDWPHFVATDLYRMLVVRIPDQPPLSIENMLIPADIFTKVKASDNAPEMVKKYLEVTGYTTPESLNVKSFPKWTELAFYSDSGEAKAKFTGSKAKLLDLIETCAMTSSGTLELELCAEFLTLRSEDKNAKTQLHMEVARSEGSEDFCININHKYLDQAVLAMPEDAIDMTIILSPEDKFSALQLSDQAEEVIVFLSLLDLGTGVEPQEEDTP